MGFILTPVCDRCGKKGYENQTYAQMKIVERNGRIRTMDLCAGCEEQLGGWIELPTRKDEEGNGDGTD